MMLALLMTIPGSTDLGAMHLVFSQAAKCSLISSYNAIVIQRVPCSEGEHITH